LPVHVGPFGNVVGYDDVADVHGSDSMSLFVQPSRGPTLATAYLQHSQVMLALEPSLYHCVGSRVDPRRLGPIPLLIPKLLQALMHRQDHCRVFKDPVLLVPNPATRASIRT
jgi:hypothetical protein